MCDKIFLVVREANETKTIIGYADSYYNSLRIVATEINNFRKVYTIHKESKFINSVVTQHGGLFIRQLTTKNVVAQYNTRIGYNCVYSIEETLKNKYYPGYHIM